MSVTELAKFAERQHGLITYAQLLEAGVAKSTVGRWARTGRLVRLQPRVYVVPGAPCSWERDLLAAVLSAGGVAAMRSAARVWGLLDGDETVEVVIARGRKATLSRALVHVASGPIESVRRRGIDVTTPPYTLVTLGSTVTQQALTAAVSKALIKRLVTVAALDAALRRISTPGRRGSSALRAVLADFELGARPPDSVLETRMLRLMRGYHLPTAAFQHEVRHGDFRARIDFAYPARMIAIEVEGSEYHIHPWHRERDNFRRNRLTSLGWKVLVFSWLDVLRRPEYVATTIALELAR